MIRKRYSDHHKDDLRRVTMRVGKRHRASLSTIGASVVIGLVLAGTLASTAEAQECQILTIENRVITSRSGNVTTVHTTIDGTLWVNVGELEADADLGVGSISFDVAPDVVGATVCPDGSVAFDLADPAPVPVVIDAPGVELLTETEVAELRPEVREAYIALHPGNGGVSEF